MGLFLHHVIQAQKTPDVPDPAVTFHFLQRSAMNFCHLRRRLSRKSGLHEFEVAALNE
jgi:hypothetical protein